MKRYQYGRRLIEPRHQYRRWIDRRVWSLRLADVLAYLRQRGWTQVPPDREGSLVFQEPASVAPEGRPFYQFVPDAEHYDDYPQRMFELVTGLAEVEDRQAADVIDDILRLAGHDPANGAAREQPRQTETTSR
jgi:hypothetical protein